MRIDRVVMHTDDIGDTVGNFFGSPIRRVNLLDVDLREIRDAQMRARMYLGKDYTPAEVFSGETVSRGTGLKDNIIRRTTTAEVVGEKFYEPKIQCSFEDSIVGLQPPDYWHTYYNVRAQ